MRAGYVLVGGKSSRFGRDKALVEVGGRALALLVAERVREAAGDVVLVGSALRYGDLGLPVIEDRVDEFGPAAGIAAALEHSSARWNLIVACDMPRVTASLFELLLETAENGDADAVVPIQPDGYEQPLCAVYSSALLNTFRAAIERGDGKILTALAGAKVRYLQPREYAQVGGDESLFANLNTPADFAELG